MISQIGNSLKTQGLALVRVDISGSDFQKSLKSKDIGLNKELDKKLGALGRKKVLGSEYPKQLRNNRDQTHTYLDKMGVRFGQFGTWAVPVDIYNEVVDSLKDKQAERNRIKANLLRDYETEVHKFAEEAEELQEGFGEIVLENAYDKAHIESQIQFSIEVQDEMLSGVSISAINALSRMAKDYEYKILKKAKETNTRPVITRFTRNVLEEMREYCYRFVFLTNVLNQAAELIEDTIKCLPDTVVKGQQYLTETSTLMTTLKLLKTPDELEGIITLGQSDLSAVEPDELESDEFVDETNVVTLPSAITANDDDSLSDDLEEDYDNFEEYDDFEVNIFGTTQQHVSLHELCD